MTRRLRPGWQALMGAAVGVGSSLFVEFACDSAESDTRSGQATVVASGSEARDLASTRQAKVRRPPVQSLLQLIARPGDHDGEAAAVSGYFVIERDWGVNGLMYVNREAAEWELGDFVGVRLGSCTRHAAAGAVLEDDELDEYNKTYVTVYGVFEATPGGMHPGIVCGVKRLVEQRRSTRFAPGPSLMKR